MSRFVFRRCQQSCSKGAAHDLCHTGLPAPHSVLPFVRFKYAVGRVWGLSIHALTKESTRLLLEDQVQGKVQVCLSNTAGCLRWHTLGDAASMVEFLPYREAGKVSVFKAHLFIQDELKVMKSET